MTTPTRPTLRPYQVEALEASETDQALKQLTVLPTGTGKTVLFAEQAKRRSRIGRVLILVHRDELVRQTVAKLHDAGLNDIGIIQADEASGTRTRITVASVQTLSRVKRAEAYVRHGLASTLIIDEAHHAPAPTYRDVIEWCLEPDGLLYGLTATPDRDMQGSAKRRHKGDVGHSFTTKMADVFDSLVYYRSLSDMIAEGWLVDLLPATVAVDMGLDTVRTSNGDWQAGDLGEHMQAAQVETDIVTAWAKAANDRPTLAFLPTVDMSRALAAEFERHGYAAEHIDGTTPVELRQDTYRRLREGRTRVVCNCMVLTEGFDEPSVSCVIVARPTKSRALFAQMVGRGTRLYPGKANCLVLSVVDHDLDLSPVRLQDLMGDHDWVDGQTFAERQDEVAEQAEKEAKERTEAEEESFAFRQAFKERTKARLTWRKVGPTWRLNLGKEGWLTLVQEGISDAGAELWRPLLPTAASGDLDTPLMTLEGATGWAEHYAQLTGADKLSDPGANWRSLEPTEAQTKLAKRWGINPQGYTRGQLSDKLSDRNAEAPTEKQISYARRLGWIGDPRTATKRELMVWIAKNGPA